MTHPLVERDKGTGLVMVCTFGDLTDVTWWRELRPAGALGARASTAACVDVPWGEAGLGVRATRRRPARPTPSSRGARSTRRASGSSSCSRQSGDLVGEPQPVTRAVKFFEKGERPVEIVTSRQWFIRTLDHRDALIERGRELHWHPPYMRARFEDWVNGLTGDWCISRQRFFGVPFPVWYPVDEAGAVLYDAADRGARRRAARSTRRPTCPPATRSRSAAGRAASSATPT